MQTLMHHTAPIHHGHKVQLYEEGSFPSPAILDFLLDGLVQKNAVVIVATEQNYRHLERGFAERGVSLPTQIEQGAIIYRDAEALLDTLWRDGQIDSDAFESGLGPEFSALLERYPAVFAYAEMVDLLLQDGKIQQMLDLEEIWNKFLVGRKINLFCGYHIDWIRPEYGPELIDQIVGKHNTLVPIQLNADTPVQHAMWIEFIHARKTKFRKELAKLTAIEEEMARDLRGLEELNRGVTQKHDQQDRWIAHYLNDELAENLISLQLSLAALPTVLKDVPADRMAVLNAKLEELTSFVKHMAETVRDAVEKIHTPLLEDFGLAAALRSFIYANRSYSAKVILSVTPPDFRLDPDIEQSVLEVLRGAITNAVQHTEASNIQVELNLYGSQLTCKVTDNGLGFSPSEPSTGLGLPMMRQRVAALGGSLNIDSNPGSGTTVNFTLRV